MRTEHMLDAGADAALRAVRRRLGLRQRMAARRAHMDAAAEASLFQCRLIRGRAISTVSENVSQRAASLPEPVAEDVSGGQSCQLS